MKIGELSRRTGIGIDTVRYYERQGLLRPASRMASGYRLFDEDDVARLQFVRRAKGLGFTLEEIRELLALSDHREDDMASLNAVASAKLVDVERRLAELERMRDGLRSLIDACPGHGAMTRCPILNALVEDAA
ncbi:heavy metal-responsive transcriptional regulator [Marilutibacter chinensis]|uniref:Heavy metal-responsive transcriptional regulator n=1 Tax=Marilutibacter chinensis TaxID=2912247 RepID=A0ABS9HN13_9GAMM|nr:heavy metal-responsive transcriptional regulator [Lysobacter chinensis]MCF7220405.1 heavy metal-responsive transcriptional regulator [Lysobacter chinensis]